LKKLFLLAALLVLLASFLASTFPDGLELVAEKLGFAEKGAPSPALLLFTGNGPFSSVLGGLIGIFILTAIARGVVYLVQRGGYNRKK